MPRDPFFLVTKSNLNIIFFQKRTEKEGDLSVNQPEAFEMFLLCLKGLSILAIPFNYLQFQDPHRSAP
jgi:hypothetical protein